MKRLKFVSLIILFASIFLFAGCANIEYQRLVDDYGQILDKITIEVDSQKLSSDVNVDHLVQNIESDLINYYIRPMELRLLQYKLDYPTDFHNLQSQIKIGSVIHSVDEGIYKISVETLFANSKVMAYVYGHDSSEDADSNSPLLESKSFFIKKYEQRTDNVFGDITTIDLNGDNVYERYRTYVGEEYDASDVTLTQIYGSTNSRMRTNADSTMEYNGFTCHLWEFNGADSSRELVFYYVTANTTGWYVLALIITAFSTAIIVIVYYTRKKYGKYKTKLDMPYTPKQIDDDSEE